MGICESKPINEPKEELKTNAKLDRGYQIVPESPNKPNYTKSNKLNNEINYIIAEIYIKEDDINKYIRILNSYEESDRDFDDYWHDYPDNYFELKLESQNEMEIKNCEIRINEELIPFNYFNKFKKKGKYIIIYI